MSKTPVTPQKLTAWSDAYKADKARQISTLVFGKNDVKASAYSAADGFAVTHKFSVDIPTLPATDQQNSGRCWLFSATNVVREKIAKDLNLENFELSQSFLAFWDKFERCNYFLEAMIETAALPTDDRTVSFLLQTGVHDGGQWEMFVNIVKKYGLIPKDAYGETYQSSHTRSMNAVLNCNLKHCAAKLRGMVASGASDIKIHAEKDKMLGEIYGFLCSCYTEPPKTFDFEYVDKDKKFHSDRGLTPETFRDKYVGDMLDKIVSIVNAPTADKPFDKTYVVTYLGNVVGNRDVQHLNLTMDDFKAAVVRQLQAGKVVWFGSDCGKQGERDAGIWDDQSFNASLITGLELDLTKAEALDYGFSAMNHAMVITGVNLVEGKPTRWKIENSWGEKSGVKGYYVCSDSWFDRYVYQAAVEKQYLGSKAALADQKPIALKPWDPMGTLAD